MEAINYEKKNILFNSNQSSDVDFNQETLNNPYKLFDFFYYGFFFNFGDYIYLDYVY